MRNQKIFKFMEPSLNERTIKQSIFEVITFFDMFDFPLTWFEIWKYLPIKCQLSEVQKALYENELREKIGNKNGFYFLKGREEIIVVRMKRYNYANEKFKKALFICGFFKLIPWLRMVAIGNMIGSNNLKKESDIDLFIVAQTGRIWLTRLFCVGLAVLLRMRPRKNNFKNKICLSFFVSEDALNLEALTLKNDKYFLYWLADLTPVYGLGTYKKFVFANNWMRNDLPNWEEFNPVSRIINKPANVIFCKIFDSLIGWTEKIIRTCQLNYMPRNIKNLMEKNSSCVVINDKVLKFHLNDRRGEYNKLFFEKFSS